MVQSRNYVGLDRRPWIEKVLLATSMGGLTLILAASFYVSVLLGEGGTTMCTNFEEVHGRRSMEGREEKKRQFNSRVCGSCFFLKMALLLCYVWGVVCMNTHMWKEALHVQ